MTDLMLDQYDQTDPASVRMRDLYNDRLDRALDRIAGIVPDDQRDAYGDHADDEYRDKQ